MPTPNPQYTGWSAKIFLYGQLIGWLEGRDDIFVAGLWQQALNAGDDLDGINTVVSIRSFEDRAREWMQRECPGLDLEFQFVGFDVEDGKDVCTAPLLHTDRQYTQEEKEVLADGFWLALEKVFSSLLQNRASWETHKPRYTGPTLPTDGSPIPLGDVEALLQQQLGGPDYYLTCHADLLNLFLGICQQCHMRVVHADTIALLVAICKVMKG